MEWWRPDLLWPVIGAVGAGATVGLEREFRARAAGFRTHILVALSSTVLMLAAKHQVEWAGPLTPAEMIRVDPVRMAHGILTGIGFLCGGVIFKEGLNVHGLTTAASLWITAALGILFGVGFYTLGIGATALTLVVLTALRMLDRHLPAQAVIDIRLCYAADGAPTEAMLRDALKAKRLHIGRISQRSQSEGATVEFAGSIEGPTGFVAEEVVEAARASGRLLDYVLQHRSG